MRRFVFADFVNTVLAAAVNTTQLTISVSSATNIPLVATGQQYALVVMDSTQSLFEVMYVTGVSGTTLTVLRGQEGTTAQSWITGDAVYGCITAGVATRLIQRIRQQQTLSANTVLASSSSGQSIFTSGALTTTLPSATEPGINNTIFGNATGAVTITTGVIPPGAATLSSVAGGTLAATTYYVKTTFVTAQGQETLPSAEQSIAVVADDLLTVVNASATGTQAATWNLYVGTTSGGETLQASGLVLGATWTEATTGITTTGNTYPTTQNGYIITPDGTQQTSYTLAESNVAGMYVESDGANYRATTFGPTIVANATAANEAVALGQWTYWGDATAGGRKDPAGNIEQWGQFAPISVGATTGDVLESVTFPIPFTVASDVHVQVGLSEVSGGASGDIFVGIIAGDTTTTTFTAQLCNTETVAQTFGFTWTARGR